MEENNFSSWFPKGTLQGDASACMCTNNSQLIGLFQLNLEDYSTREQSSIFLNSHLKLYQTS